MVVWVYVTLFYCMSTHGHNSVTNVPTAPGIPSLFYIMYDVENYKCGAVQSLLPCSTPAIYWERG